MVKKHAATKAYANRNHRPDRDILQPEQADSRFEEIRRLIFAMQAPAQRQFIIRTIPACNSD